MNLFTTYIKKEISFLLSLNDLSKKYLVDKKEFEYIYVKFLKVNDLIKDYDFVIILNGELGVIRNKKIVKRLSNGDIFGIQNLKQKCNDSLISIKNGEVLFFKLKSQKSKFFYNLLVFKILNECNVE